MAVATLVCAGIGSAVIPGRTRKCLGSSGLRTWCNYSPTKHEHVGSQVKFTRRHLALLLPASTLLASPPLEAAQILGQDLDCSSGDCRAVQLITLSGCGLGVARYPDFVYNAEGGGGSGVARELPDGRTFIRFDADKLKIPPVSMQSTTLLGLPLPPFLKIEIAPKCLEGYAELSSGKVELNFLANFEFSIGALYKAPPLVVNTMLTTEKVQGTIRGGQGRRLDSNGDCELAGVAKVSPVQDALLNTFLTLPTDCLAQLKANISFPS